MKLMTLMEVTNALHDLGYSQQTQAKIAKVAQGTISRWMRDNPALVNMKALDRLTKKLNQEKAQRGIK